MISDLPTDKLVYLASPYSHPVWRVREQRFENVRYSVLYDMGYKGSGCMFCMFGCHLEGLPNRFQRMRLTHPKQWSYCMDKLGLRRVLEYIKVPYDDGPLMRAQERLI